MRAIRCKFKVDEITRTRYGYGPDGKEVRSVKLSPVYSNVEGSENKVFWDATPSGSLQFLTVNAQAADALVLGGEYYVDLTPAG